jgi:hypothetical protein
MVEIVTDPRWRPLGHPAPPDATQGCALASGLDGPVMVIQKDWRTLSVWRWSGARWVPEIADLMPGLDPTADCPVACYSPADGGYLVGCVTGARELRLLRLNDGVALPRVALGDVVTYSGTLLAPPPGDELVLQLSSDTLTVSQGQARLRAREPEMRTVAADPTAGRVVGIEKFGLTFVGDFGDGAASGWRRLDAPAVAEHSTLVYDPGRDRVVCLVPDADRSVTGLHALEGEQWVAVDPPVTMPGRGTDGLLAVEAGSGALLYFGGDLDDGETTTSATWRSVGGDFRLMETPFDPPPTDARIPLTLDGCPAVVDVRTRSVYVLRDDRWQPWTTDATDEWDWQRFDARSLNFTAGDDAVWMLDAEGGAWRTDANGSFHQVAPAEPGPGSRLTRKAAIAWQEPEGRLVLVGGRQRNDTWALERGRWQRLNPQGSPPHGSGVAAATPYGVYLFVGAELWGCGPTRGPASPSPPMSSPTSGATGACGTTAAAMCCSQHASCEARTRTPACCVSSTATSSDRSPNCPATTLTACWPRTASSHGTQQKTGSSGSSTGSTTNCGWTRLTWTAAPCPPVRRLRIARGCRRPHQVGAASPFRCGTVTAR